MRVKKYRLSSKGGFFDNSIMLNYLSALIFLNFIVFFQSFNRKKSPTFIIKQNNDLRNKIFFLILTSPVTYEKRHRRIFESWGKKFLKSPYFGGIGFSTVPECNDSNIIHPSQKDLLYRDSLPWAFHEKTSVDLQFKTMIGINYFIQNSNVGWLARIVDDTWVNVDKIANMLNVLNNEYDPFKDIAIKGSCIDYHPFIHGGSGYVISRKACEIYNADRYEFNRQLALAEDLHFNLFIERVGLTMNEVTSEFHAGFSFGKQYTDAILNQAYNVIPDCKRFILPAYTFCKSFTSKFNQIVFVHDHFGFLNLSQFEPLYNTPNDNVTYFSFRSFPCVCMKNDRDSIVVFKETTLSSSPYFEPDLVNAVLTEKMRSWYKFHIQKNLMKQWNQTADLHFQAYLETIPFSSILTVNQTERIRNEFLTNYSLSHPKPTYWLKQRYDYSEVDPTLNYTAGEWNNYYPTFV